MKRYQIPLGTRTIDLGKRTCIMGIVNVTPDSFSDGGRFLSQSAAVSHAEMIADQGADIIDIGGESSRPFSNPVSIEEEFERVIPVISELKNRIDTPISIDTTKALVAKQAISAGASIINDISSFRMDPDMASVAVASKVPVILMHMLERPKTMQISPTYNDVISEIIEFLGHRIDYAVSNGISREKIIVDPGIGFGKTVGHNLTVIKYLKNFERLDAPILIGPSRKAFIRSIIKKKSEKDISTDRPDVEIGTQAAIAASIQNGAHIVRVHNVANTKATVKLIDAINNI